MDFVSSLVDHLDTPMITRPVLVAMPVVVRQVLFVQSPILDVLVPCPMLPLEDYFANALEN